MCRCGAVQLQTRHPINIIERIGQIHKIIFDVRFVTFTRFKVTTGGAHEKIASPQGAQIHIDTPLHIHEQRALALLLQHRQRLFGFQAEVTYLLFKIDAVRVRPPSRPTPQTTQGQLAKQQLEIFQHRTQAARDLIEQGVDQLQIGPKQGRVTQAFSRSRCGTHNCFQHRATGF